MKFPVTITLLLVGYVFSNEVTEKSIENEPNDKQSKRSLPGLGCDDGLVGAAPLIAPALPVSAIGGVGGLIDPGFGIGGPGVYAPAYGSPLVGPIGVGAVYPGPQFTRVDIDHPVPVPVVQAIPVPVPHPVPVSVPHPVPVPQPVPYEREVIKHVPFDVEKPVPYTVQKPYPVEVTKKVPYIVPKPYPVHYTVYKEKHYYPKKEPCEHGW